MSDIIERLHSYSHARDFTGEPILAAELRRAADEITALRAQVAALKAEQDSAETRVLEMIEAWRLEAQGNWSDGYAEGVNDACEQISDRVRAALTVKP